MDYAILKSIHLVAVLAWSAGLFYIGRIFVYYVESQEQDSKTTLATMAIRLSRYIMLPASIITLLVGLHLAGIAGAFSHGWFQLKLFLLFLLFGYQHFSSKLSKQLVNGTFNKSSQWCRRFNEVPIVLLTGIVFSAITKHVTTSIIAAGAILIALILFFILKKPVS